MAHTLPLANPLRFGSEPKPLTRWHCWALSHGRLLACLWYRPCTTRQCGGGFVWLSSSSSLSSKKAACQFTGRFIHVFWFKQYPSMHCFSLECTARQHPDGNDGTQSRGQHHQRHHREFTIAP